jgi:hypothetical protein
MPEHAQEVEVRMDGVFFNCCSQQRSILTPYLKGSVNTDGPPSLEWSVSGIMSVLLL